MSGSPPSFAFTNLRFPRYKQEIRTHVRLDKGSDYLVVVDPRGVEPLSENRSIQPSPSASCLFEFPFPYAGKQAYGKSSFFLYDSFKSKRAVHIYR